LVGCSSTRRTDVAGLSTFAARDQHFDTRVAAFEYGIDAALATELAHDLGLAARQDLHEMALAATRRITGPHGDAIALPEHLHLARREVQIVAAVVRLEEAEAVAMRGHGARHDIEMLREAELVGPITRQLPVGPWPAAALPAPAAVLLGANAKARGERLEEQRLPGLLHGAQDLVAARDVVFVLTLAGGVGVMRRTRH
jgi:hypothetical protein